MKTNHLVLTHSLACWSDPDFADVLKAELGEINPARLPLQNALRHGSHVSEHKPSFTLLKASEEEMFLRVKLGVFFQGIMAGCNCSDDPSVDVESNEYAVIELLIDKPHAVTQCRLLDDELD